VAAGVAAGREVLEQILATSHAERSATKTWHDYHPDQPPPLPPLTLGGLGILGSPHGTGPRLLETTAQRPGLGR